MKTITKTFENVLDMDNFIKTYLREYAPAGYDTEVKIVMEQSYEMWQNNLIKYIVTIERLDSCN